MNRCKRCKILFTDEEARVVKDDPSPRGISLPSGYYAYHFCPNCGSDDFSEDFELAEAVDIEPGDEETSMVISFEGKKFMLYLDENGKLDCIEEHEPEKQASKPSKARKTA